jgi:hypothetical protein
LVWEKTLPYLKGAIIYAVSVSIGLTFIKSLNIAMSKSCIENLKIGDIVWIKRNYCWARDYTGIFQAVCLGCINYKGFMIIGSNFPGGLGGRRRSIEIDGVMTNFNNSADVVKGKFTFIKIHKK